MGLVSSWRDYNDIPYGLLQRARLIIEAKVKKQQDDERKAARLPRGGRR